jgi:hypothetical protein
MLGAKTITATLTGESLEGSVDKCCPKRGILLLIAVKPGCRRTHRTWEWLFYDWVCAIIISRKFINTNSQLLKEALSMEQKWCGKTPLSIHPKKKLQFLDQFLMKPGHSDEV